MIAYFDTSAIVKLYVEEKHSAETRAHLENVDAVATSRVAYAETIAALTKIQRQKRISGVQLERCLNDFTADWNDYIVFDVGETISKRAGRLAKQHPLRGFDAIHISTACDLQRSLEPPVHILTYDQTMNESARIMELNVLHDQ